jgi:hypothetical protein
LILSFRVAQGRGCEELRKIAFAFGLALPLLIGNDNHNPLTLAGDGLRTILKRAVAPSDIQPSVRILLEGPYLILYQTHPDTDDGPVLEIESVRVVACFASWGWQTLP